jgi:hypothetical protein
VATWLDARGYQTGLFGKYMNAYRDKLIPPGWDRWYAWNGVDEGWTAINDQGNQKPLDRHEADSLVARETLGFLSTRLDNAAPVFAFVNFGAMHSPYPYAQVDADKFKGENVPRTPSFNEYNVSDKPDYVRGLPPSPLRRSPRWTRATGGGCSPWCGWTASSGTPRTCSAGRAR